jgi:4-hydroxy-3-methylbut-2-enyl diphosphate reductase
LIIWTGTSNIFVILTGENYLNLKMNIRIDPYAGFCPGVVRAIQIAEQELRKHGQLYCLGEIVHNQLEVERLEKLGLKTILYDDFRNLKDTRVLLRSHGEPPETYRIAKKNNVELIDATCPVVLKLQEKVKRNTEEMKMRNGQLVIFGKKDHRTGWEIRTY